MKIVATGEASDEVMNGLHSVMGLDAGTGR